MMLGDDGRWNDTVVDNVVRLAVAATMIDRNTHSIKINLKPTSSTLAGEHAALPLFRSVRWQSRRMHSFRRRRRCRRRRQRVQRMSAQNI